MTDNGPQFTSGEFRDFVQFCGVRHVTSSPHNPSANGQTERGVQIAKKILKQDDPWLALMHYRATPTAATGVSPSELFIGRKIRTTLPVLKKNLNPRWPCKRAIRHYNQKKRENEKKYFDRRAIDLPPLKPGDTVRVRLENDKDWSTKVYTVRKRESTGTSYLVEGGDGSRF